MPTNCKLFATITFAIITVLLAACAQTSTTAVVADNTVAAPSTPVADNYRANIDQARQALKDGDFDTAKELAQQAARLRPTDNTPWSIFEEAVVAETADNYLRTLPESRYRLNTEHFLADQVNGTHYFILDVREADEYEAGHIDKAVNIPLRELTQNLERLPGSKTYPILVYCHTQKRATHALVILRELGYTNVFNLEGGISAYEEWRQNNPMPTPGPTPTPKPEAPSC